ncbi:MAG: cbb3-type cytochrome c oxidase subunit I, partial [Microthrixaceae bacterium]
MPTTDIWVQKITILVEDSPSGEPHEGTTHMTLTDTRPTSDNSEPEGSGTRSPVPTALERVIGTGEHQAIGRTFILSSLLLMAIAAAALAVGGLTALGSSGPLNIADPVWNSALVAMVLMGAMGLLLGLAICLVPLQVGSPAIAFPRAAALSLWAWLVAAVIFLISVPLDGGVGGSKLEGARLGMLSMGAMMVALSLGAVCVVTTVLSHRRVGMSLSRVPFFSWSMLVAAPIWILTFGSTTAHVILGQV